MNVWMPLSWLAWCEYCTSRQFDKTAVVGDSNYHGDQAKNSFTSLFLYLHLHFAPCMAHLRLHTQSWGISNFVFTLKMSLNSLLSLTLYPTTNKLVLVPHHLLVIQPRSAWFNLSSLNHSWPAGHEFWTPALGICVMVPSRFLLMNYSHPALYLTLWSCQYWTTSQKDFPRSKSIWKQPTNLREAKQLSTK